MPLVRISTYRDLQDAFIEHTNIGTSLSDVNDFHKSKMRRLLNTSYEKIAYHKEWEWRVNTRYMKTTPQLTTGTVSVTNDSREITFSAAVTVDDTFKGRMIRVTGDTEWYEIIAVHDAASRKVMLGSPYAGTTDTAATYKVYKFKYGLWPDCADVLHVQPMGGTIFGERNELERMTPTEYLNAMGRSPFTTSTRPWGYTIMGKEDYQGVPMGSEFIMGYDFMEDDGPPETNKALHLYPLDVNETTLQITYGKQIEAMTQDDDQPLIPVEKRHVILYDALGMWELTESKNKSNADRLMGMAKEELAAMAADVDRTEERPSLRPVTRRRYNNRRRSRRVEYSCPSE